jgi:hypothetical protein
MMDGTQVGVSSLVAALDEDSPRIQQPFLNLLNLCLRERLPRLQTLLEKEKRLLPK